MPATLTAPVPTATASGVRLRSVTLNVETGTVDMLGAFVDANGADLGPAPAVQMTHTAFLTAVQAASGSLKNRLYVVYLAQAGFTASAIT